MTKRAKIAVIVVGGVILIPALTLSLWYEKYKQGLEGQPPHFDLFISEKFFSQVEHSPFDLVPAAQQRPIEWLLDQDQFETLDTVLLALKNTSGEKFYYTSWGSPLSRFRQDLIIYRNGLADTIPFGGHGCGTGVYAAPLQANETMARKISNPLMFNPYSNYDLPLSSDSFPYFFKEIYGDSVAIMFSQATYSTPWSKYRPQMIFSHYITVSTDKVLDNWRKGKFATLPEREPTMEEYYGMKKFGQ